jgi:hypothetical protein
MKNMDAMIIATVREWARTGYVPERDIVLAFLQMKKPEAIWFTLHG